MKSLLLVAFALGLAPAAARAQLPPLRYPRLSHTLDSLAYVDQWPMQRMVQQQPDSAGRNLEDVEKVNYARHQPVLERIVRQVGYPGFREVGEKSSANFWLLVQHADAHPDFQRQVLQLMLPQVQRKNVSPANYAYLTDRVANNAGLPQEYGTQVDYQGPQPLHAFVKSLRDPENVNKRRAAMGLEPLEKYLDGMNKLYLQMNTPHSAGGK